MLNDSVSSDPLLSCTHFFYFVLKVGKCLSMCMLLILETAVILFLACFNSLFCFSRPQTWAYFQPKFCQNLLHLHKILDPSTPTLKGRHTCDRISFNYLNVPQRNIKQPYLLLDSGGTGCTYKAWITMTFQLVWLKRSEHGA